MRTLLLLGTVGLLGLALAGPVVHARSEFELSAQGSGRATAYPPTNKIVTLGDRTHVTWLDSIGHGFQVQVRTLDRGTGEWSPTWTPGQAQDNHGGAALTVGPDGHLHLLYYPHHDSLRYRRSLHPNDASAWSEEESFGADLTYPVVMVAADGTLLLSARRAYDEKQGFNPPAGSRPWELELWRRPPGGRWERQGTVLRSRFPGYAQFAEAYWWGGDHRTLHLACRIYETDYLGSGELFNTVAYLVSSDAGLTWRRRDGTLVALPATAETMDVIARGGSASADVLAAGGLIIDARDEPRVLFSRFGSAGARSFLARPEPGGWQLRPLPVDWPGIEPGWELVVPGAITRTQGGRMVIAATLQQVAPREPWWAHPSNEVAQLWSDDDGATFEAERFGPVDPGRPRWLPNLERATGHHAVPERPGLIYTDGEAGRGNDAILSNRVIWRTAGP